MLYSSTSPMIFDGTTAVCFIVAMHNNATARVKNIVPGMLYTFIFHQDSHGGHAFTWPTACRNNADVGRSPGQTSVHNYIGNEGGYMDANTPST